MSPERVIVGLGPVGSYGFVSVDVAGGKEAEGV